jgi:hypothetical protein
MGDYNINILAVILVAVSNMAIGFVWYSMKGFGKAWMKENKFTMEDISGGPDLGYLFVTLTSLVMGIVMSIFVQKTGTTEIIDGAFLGLLAWVGFTAPAFIANYTFSKKSFKLFLIDSLYYLVTMIMAGIIVVGLD